ncbi:A/G-specific adenine glycosylase [Puteibacter caeruleilacunae]|nr:A/G-specific adenine glycosylase [Puteibacter caeruleilacunae]
MNFARELLEWYNIYKRDLPWRRTKDPYKIWLSEIILQQTRVDQGNAYYHAFIEKYPDVFALANADQEEVLKLWQGLGYYSRARNLHFASQEIVKLYAGNFPNDHKQVLKLKGIGEYTAAAICSIAYNQPYPVIDGNVFRVLSRVFGISAPIDTTTGKKEFKQLAEELMHQKECGAYNQALMDFGAIQCTPKKPNCSTCPFNESCYAYNNDQISVLPIKLKKIKQRERHFHYLLLEHNDHIYLNKRREKDIWQGLYELPLIETEKATATKQILNNQSIFKGNLKKNLSLCEVSKLYTHQLTHQKIFAQFYWIKIADEIEPLSPYLKVNKKDIYKFAVPKLVERYLYNWLENS